MPTRPATSLVNAISGQLKRNKPGHRISVARRTMQQWLAWAKSIDARMRLDGSKKNKQHRRAR